MIDRCVINMFFTQVVTTDHVDRHITTKRILLLPCIENLKFSRAKELPALGLVVIFVYIHTPRHELGDQDGR